MRMVSSSLTWAKAGKQRSKTKITGSESLQKILVNPEIIFGINLPLALISGHLILILFNKFKPAESFGYVKIRLRRPGGLPGEIPPGFPASDTAKQVSPPFFTGFGHFAKGFPRNLHRY